MPRSNSALTTRVPPISDELQSSGPVSQLANPPTSVGLASFLRQGGQFGKRTKQAKGKEKSVSTGQDAPLPWLKPPKTRGISVKIVHSVTPVAWFNSNVLSGNTASFYFTINAVQGYSSLAQVFDEYMITLVEALIEPQVSETTSAATAVGTLASVVDIDDGNTPSSISALQNYSTLQQCNGTMRHYHRWVPTVSINALGTGYVSVSNVWCDMASGTVQHYGLKAASGADAQVAQTYEISYKLHVTYRTLH